MKLGFTGTQRGLTVKQSKSLYDWLLVRGDITEFHHGDCVGSDADADYFVSNLLPSAKRIAHPCDISNKRANCKADEVRDPLPPLVRNKVIVDLTERLVATPDGPERLRSGTWSTVRYAHRIGRPVTVIMPDGSVGEFQKAA